MPKKKRPIPKKLPAKLKNIRLAAGLKQYEMRRIICPASKSVDGYSNDGYSNSPISEYEAGKRVPSLEELPRYAKFGRVTAEFLIDDEVEIYEHRNSKAGNKSPAEAENLALKVNEVALNILESDKAKDPELDFKNSQKLSDANVRLNGHALALIEDAYSEIATASLPSPKRRAEQSAFNRQRYFEITVSAAVELFFEERNQKFAVMWQQVWQKLIATAESFDEE